MRLSETARSGPAPPKRLRKLLRRLAGAGEGTICVGGYAGCGNIGDDAIVQGFLARVLREGIPLEEKKEPAWLRGGAETEKDRDSGRGSPASVRAWGEAGSAGCGSEEQSPGSGRRGSVDGATGSGARSDAPDFPEYPELLLRITLLSGSPRRDARRFGVRCVHRKNPFSLVRSFLRSEYFLCGGGSLLQNATGRLSLCYYLALLRLARWCGCRTALLSAGIGPLHGASARRAVARELNRCAWVGLRDPDSLRMLAELGVRSELLGRAPDPAFFLPPPPPSRLPFLLHEAGIPQQEGYLCVALHAPCAASDGLMHAVTAALRRMRNRHGLRAVFVLFDTKADGAPSCRVAGEVGGTVLRLREASDALAVISGARFLFAMRLHALIFSVMAGTPALALSVSPGENKLAVFCRAAGIPHLRAPSPEALTDGMERLLANREHIRVGLPAVRDALVNGC